MHIYVKTLLTSDEWPLLIKVTKLKSSQIYQRMKNSKIASFFKHKIKYHATQTFSCNIFKVMSRISTLALNAKNTLQMSLKIKNRKSCCCWLSILHFPRMWQNYLLHSIIHYDNIHQNDDLMSIVKAFARIWTWKFFQGVYYIAQWFSR